MFVHEGGIYINSTEFALSFAEFIDNISYMYKISCCLDLLQDINSRNAKDPDLGEINDLLNDLLNCFSIDGHINYEIELSILKKIGEIGNRHSGMIRQTYKNIYDILRV